MAPKVEGSSPFNHLGPELAFDVDFGFFYFLRRLRSARRGDFSSFCFSASGVSAFEERRNGKTKATFDRWGAKRKKTPFPDCAGVGEKKTRRKTDASF